MTTYLLGVQWETTSMRLASVRRLNSGKTTLIRVDTLTFTDDASRLTVFKDWVREHIPQNSTVQVTLTVPESHIILKELELPPLKGQELAEAVHWELTDKSGVGAESSTAWQVVGKQADQLRVAAMIMKKSEIASALTFFADAGVELTAIEPSSVSAGRILTLPGATSVLLSFEEAEVSAVFVRAGVPVFSTSFAIPLTDAAVRAKHLSRDAASALVVQLKRIIAYWNDKEEKVSRIIVLGEAAGYSGIKSDVARGLSVSLVIGEAVKSSVLSTKAVGPAVVAQYASAIGSTLRGAGEEINFLPKENRMSLEKRAFTTHARMRLWQFTKVNIGVLVLLAALSAYLWASQLAYAKNIAQTQRFIDNHPAQKYVAHITSVNALLTAVSTLLSDQVDTGVRLRYLSSVTPPKLHFSSLKMVGGAKEEWLISGTGDRADILAFYYKLKADGEVKDVSMPYSNFDSETNSPFTVTIVW